MSWCLTQWTIYPDGHLEWRRSVCFDGIWSVSIDCFVNLSVALFIVSVIDKEANRGGRGEEICLGGIIIIPLQTCSEVSIDLNSIWTVAKHGGHYSCPSNSFYSKWGEGSNGNTGAWPRATPKTLHKTGKSHHFNLNKVQFSKLVAISFSKSST